MNWIPMNEKKPTKSGYYLVTYADFARKEDRVEVDSWDDLGEFWDVFGNYVKAWAELPEPYRRTQNEAD